MGSIIKESAQRQRSINDCAPNFYGPIVRFSLRHCPPHQQYHLKKKTPSNQNIVKKNRNKITTNITLSVMSASNNFLRIPKVWFFNQPPFHHRMSSLLPKAKIRVICISIWDTLTPVISAPWPLCSENSA